MLTSGHVWARSGSHKGALWKPLQLAGLWSKFQQDHQQPYGMPHTVCWGPLASNDNQQQAITPRGATKQLPLVLPGLRSTGAVMIASPGRCTTTLVPQPGHAQGTHPPTRYGNAPPTKALVALKVCNTRQEHRTSAVLWKRQYMQVRSASCSCSHAAPQTRGASKGSSILSSGLRDRVRGMSQLGANRLQHGNTQTVQSAAGGALGAHKSANTLQPPSTH